MEGPQTGELSFRANTGDGYPLVGWLVLQLILANKFVSHLPMVRAAALPEGCRGSGMPGRGTRAVQQASKPLRRLTLVLGKLSFHGGTRGVPVRHARCGAGSGTRRRVIPPLVAVMHLCQRCCLPCRASSRLGVAQGQQPLGKTGTLQQGWGWGWTEAQLQTSCEEEMAGLGRGRGQQRRRMPWGDPAHPMGRGTPTRPRGSQIIISSSIHIKAKGSLN